LVALASCKGPFYAVPIVQFLGEIRKLPLSDSGATFHRDVKKLLGDPAVGAHLKVSLNQRAKMEK